MIIIQLSVLFIVTCSLEASQDPSDQKEGKCKTQDTPKENGSLYILKVK